MKSKIVLVNLFFALFSSTLMAGHSPTLTNNFCKPLVDSKKYLTSNFSMNYPKRVQFECTYECMVNNKVSQIIGLSTVSVSSMDDDAQNVVCQGVRVKKVSWGYDFDGIDLFYAFDAATSEVKRFAFENINQKDKTINEELQKLQKLKADIYIVAAAYAQAGAQSGAIGFSEAADTLTKIANQLPSKTILLDEVIKQIVVNKGQIAQDARGQSLTERVIMSGARWRIPTYLF